MAKTGTNLLQGEVWSQKYLGFIERPDGWLRKPGVRIDKNGVVKCRNSYFLPMSCCVCGKFTLKDKSNIRKTPNAVCSRECQTKLATAPEGDKKYKRGSPGGYVMIKKSDHPNRNNQDRVPEHRLIVEQDIGRLLGPLEVVHHINLVKDDNRIANLVLLQTRVEHEKTHASLNKCVAELMSSGKLAFSSSTHTYKVV